jgi:tRNA pseudouridine55 synthase
MMNGILLINKVSGMTSNAVIQKIKRILKVKKIGHAGTLDPLATGLLVVLINEATKLSNYLLNQDKEYLGEIVLGLATDTEDATGEIIAKQTVTKIADPDAALRALVGKREQIPPMYSALKKDGKKLYELAREGKTIEREPREVEIYALERRSPVTYENGLAKFSFYCKVSKGTYVRTLCTEIGTKLGLPAHMSRLERLASGSFRLDDAVSLADVEAGDYRLISMVDALDFPKVEVDDTLAAKIKNGNILPAQLVGSKEPLLVFKQKDRLLAIYKYKEGKYYAERVWN